VFCNLHCIVSLCLAFLISGLCALYYCITVTCTTFRASMLLVGCQEEHLVCKKIEWWDAGVVICLEWGAYDLHMIQLMPLSPHHSCFIKIQIGLTFLVPAYQRCPRKEAINQVSVCTTTDSSILVTVPEFLWCCILWTIELDSFWLYV